MATSVKMADIPFASGGFKYAFRAKEIKLGKEIVMKVPKVINSKKYTLEHMSKELEMNSICQHIVSLFNKKMVY